MDPFAGKDIIELPRGGYLTDTSEGYIQLGSPPETIKDTMGFEKKTPLIFILPNRFFHTEKGISTAELEFPIYFNYFLRGKKTSIVCTEEQKEQLIVVLRESIFGPDKVDLSSEYINGEKSYGFPDMQAEMKHFSGNRLLEDLVEFHVFGGTQSVVIGKVTINQMENGGFEIVDGARAIQMPGEVGFNIKYDIGSRLPEPYKAPLLGITCLGPSHGFDPTANTSGFIIWLNHQGIMVDPPVNSTEWLRESNVNPRLINHVILTHCHADHDAGTFQKILEEGKITIHATSTVMESFLRKYCAMTKIPRKELMDLFNFEPVIIGKAIYINGGEFRFNYALHSIPSTGFEFFFQDQSFVYTSDHLNDSSVHDELYKSGVLTESRWRHIKDFPWDRNIIYHEAGIPPLHTPISYLTSLPVEIQKKITVYHISKNDMPENSHLKLATFGMENTFYPEITPPKYEDAYNLLDILSQIDIFQNFTIEKAKEFLLIVKEEKYKRGERIFQKDTPGDRFFIIVSGSVKFEGLDSSDPDRPVKRYSSYEYFGEASLILNTPRAADVYAETDVAALTIEKNHFMQFIRGSDLKEDLIRLNKIRNTNSWQMLSESNAFKSLTSYQKTQLELILLHHKSVKGEILIRENEFFDKVYILKEGKVAVLKGKQIVTHLGPGDFIGDVYHLIHQEKSPYSFITQTDIEIYALLKEDIIQYLKKNPGVYMRMNPVYS